MDKILKTTELGFFSVEVSLDGEAARTPVSEVVDLVRVLRETADNLEKVAKHCTDGNVLGANSLMVH